MTEILAGFYQPDEHRRRRPESLYGATKMWAHLHRLGIPVARCTVERLMRRNGWRGVVRTKKVRTTISDRAASRAADLVDRCFTATAPNQLLVADFTYVRVRAGFVYTAFVIDAFAGMIVGWDVTATANAAMVERALADGLELRRRQGHPILPGAVHHSDAGSQGGFKQSSQHLDQEVLEWDVGHAGSQRRREGRRCGRPGEHRWRIVSIGCGFGNRSPVGRPVRMLGLEPACHRRLERDGSVRLAGCLHPVSSRTAAAI